RIADLVRDEAWLEPAREMADRILARCPAHVEPLVWRWLHQGEAYADVGGRLRAHEPDPPRAPAVARTCSPILTWIKVEPPFRRVSSFLLIYVYIPHAPGR